MDAVKTTKKITDAMRLVSAAKVLKAQESVVKSRPFMETLTQILDALPHIMRFEGVDSPLLTVRPVHTILIVCMTADRGLCGGYNAAVIKKTEARCRELQAAGIHVRLLMVGARGAAALARSKDFKESITGVFSMSQEPTAKDAQVVADEVFASFVGGDVDRVEVIFSKFVSLMTTEPVVEALLPLTAPGRSYDVGGTSIGAQVDEDFKVTTHDGHLVVEAEPASPVTKQHPAAGAGQRNDPTAAETLPLPDNPFLGDYLFGHDPEGVLDSLLPLYLSSTVLRCMHEALASELASRMRAMSAASDAADDLRHDIQLQLNRGRQARITTELAELVAGTAAVS